MDRALTVVLGFVVTAIVMLAGVALVLTLRADDDAFEVTFTELEPTDFPPVEHDPDAALALIDTWARWRTGTFVASGSWTRTVDGRDDPLTGPVFIAQDPPRRFVIRLGAEVANLDDAERYDDFVATDLALVGGYVVGESRLYDVSMSAPGCFQAELVVPALASPWGRWAEYCFDEETGSLISARVRRQSAIDVEVITEVRSDVTEADFG